jgi:hypothetical protein
VQHKVREEIGSSKFCIMVDEARDESKKEQMAIVLRFVNKEGHIKERFLDLIHVSDTLALTLKDAICSVMSDNNLSVQDTRGQGYDGKQHESRVEWLEGSNSKRMPLCLLHPLHGTSASIGSSSSIKGGTRGAQFFSECKFHHKYC